MAADSQTPIAQTVFLNPSMAEFDGEPKGVVDSLGYLYCLGCAHEHGKTGAKVYGPPHSQETCEACKDRLDGQSYKPELAGVQKPAQKPAEGDWRKSIESHPVFAAFTPETRATIARNAPTKLAGVQKPVQKPTSDVYVVCVNLPGCLPEMEPYAIRGKNAAYVCAQHELDDDDSLGYSLAEWSSALDAGGASVYLNSGYVLEVTPLDSLGLDDDDRADYLENL